MIMRRLFDKKIKVPGAEQKFVAYGVEYCEDMDIYLICGYIKKGKAVRIYILESDGNYRCKDICVSHNKPLKCQATGIARAGNYIYVTGNDERCYVMELDELLRLDSSAAIIATSFKAGNHASFCRVYNDFLYIGEYGSKHKRYSESIYTPGGEKNYGLICAYRIKNSGITGVEKHPEFAFSIRDKVTGICFTKDGKILLSVYSNLISSYIYAYNCQTAFQLIKNEKIIHGKHVIVYYLDKLSQTGARKRMTKIRDLIYVGGEVTELMSSNIRKTKNLSV